MDMEKENGLKNTNESERPRLVVGKKDQINGDK
jgi:hypothetical protein